MTYAFTTEDGERKIGGSPSDQEKYCNDERDDSVEWDSENESWDEFMARTQ